MYLLQKGTLYTYFIFVLWMCTLCACGSAYIVHEPKNKENLKKNVKLNCLVDWYV